MAIDYTLGKGKVWALAERHAVPCRSLSEVNATQLVAEIERALDAERPAPVGDIVFPAALGAALRRLVPERP